MAAYTYFCKHTGKRGYIDLNIHTKEYEKQRKQQGLKPLKHGDRCVSIVPDILTLFLSEVIKALENKKVRSKSLYKKVNTPKSPSLYIVYSPNLNDFWTMLFKYCRIFGTVLL